MRGNLLKGVFMAFLATLAAATVFAAPWGRWQGSGGWGGNGAYQRLYNPATVETLKGTVESVDKITPMRGMNYGIHLTVKTEKGTLPVHLGPVWYIERQDTKFAKGDIVEVKGSMVNFNGNPALIAAEVKKGEALLKLRDERGFPFWAGWRR